MPKQNNETDEEFISLIIHLGIYNGLIKLWETSQSAKTKNNTAEFIRLCITEQNDFLPQTYDQKIEKKSKEIIQNIINSLNEQYIKNINEPKILEYMIENIKNVDKKLNKFPKNKKNKKLLFHDHNENSKEESSDEEFNMNIQSGKYDSSDEDDSDTSDEDYENSDEDYDEEEYNTRSKNRKRKLDDDNIYLEKYGDFTEAIEYLKKEFSVKVGEEE